MASPERNDSSGREPSPGSTGGVLGRADFVGRDAELERLARVGERILRGEGGLVTVRGEAGTGKTRLVEEFRSSLGDDVLWVRARARPDRADTPYDVLADLLRVAWGISETAASDEIVERIGVSTARQLPEDPDAAHILGRLFGIESVELDGVDPEVWRARVHELVGKADTGPSVIQLEDLHWADPSSLALVRHLALGGESPTLWVLTYRPPFELTDDRRRLADCDRCEVIELGELSEREAEEMLRSLMNARELSPDLVRHLWVGAGGNPFGLQEIAQTLIDSRALVQSDGAWVLSRPVGEADGPVDLAQVLEARLDHVGEDARQVLREAATIGQEFPYELLSCMTSEPERLDASLSVLEEHDLLRTSDSGAEGHFVFRHELTREAAYRGVVEDSRLLLHERLAEVLETTYAERAAGASSQLAFHYSRGLSADKAVRYLLRSADEAIRKFAYTEAHVLLKRAFDLASDLSRRVPAHRELLVDVLLAWGMQLARRAEFEALCEMLTPHRVTVESLDDPRREIGFSTLLAAAEWGCGRPKEADLFAREALESADAIGDPPSAAGARSTYALALLEAGELERALEEAQESCELSLDLTRSSSVLWASVHSFALALWYRGDGRGALRLSDRIDAWAGERNPRKSAFAASLCRARGMHALGDFRAAAEHLEEATESVADTVHVWGARAWRGIVLAEQGFVDQAEGELSDVSRLARDRADYFVRLCDVYLGLCRAIRGEFRPAVTMVGNGMDRFRETGSSTRLSLSEYLLGKVYRVLAERASSHGASVVTEAGLSGISTVEDAGREAERWLLRAVHRTEAIGARGVSCPAYLELARLHIALGRAQQAREWATRALKDATDRGADGYAEQARGLLAAASS